MAQRDPVLGNIRIRDTHCPEESTNLNCFWCLNISNCTSASMRVFFSSPVRYRLVLHILFKIRYKENDSERVFWEKNDRSEAERYPKMGGK